MKLAIILNTLEENYVVLQCEQSTGRPVGG
jgi:hypothetical protein